MASGGSQADWRQRELIFRLGWAEATEYQFVNMAALKLAVSGPWELPVALAKLARSCIALHEVLTQRIVRQLALACLRNIGVVPPVHALLRRIRHPPEAVPVGSQNDDDSVSSSDSDL